MIVTFYIDNFIKSAEEPYTIDGLETELDNEFE